MDQEQIRTRAIKLNAVSLLKISEKYAEAAMLQTIRCTHLTGGICSVCRRLTDDLSYFSIALAVVADAAGSGKSAELLALLKDWATANLPDFPAEISGRFGGGGEPEPEFPDVIF